jgi:hypothetical protein
MKKESMTNTAQRHEESFGFFFVKTFVPLCLRGYAFSFAPESAASLAGAARPCPRALKKESSFLKERSKELLFLRRT